MPFLHYRISARIFAFSLLLCLALPAAADSSVWVVSKAGRQLFIGGTIHLLSEADYPLPDEFSQAYARADRLVFETDIAATQTPAFQQQMLQSLMYTDGRTLRSVLSATTYAELEKYCQSRGMPMLMLDGMRPQLVTVTLSMLELQRLGITSPGVDEYFYSQAQADHKPVQGLETAEQQLRFLAEMGQGREDELVLSSLREMEEMPALLEQMRRAWRSGDEQQFAQAAVDSMRTDYPAVYQSMLVARNNAWLPVIEQMLSTPEIEYVLVGAAHLVGRDGVLLQLRQRGYEVRHL